MGRGRFPSQQGTQDASQHHAHFLPAYNPELNPIENVWHFLKSHHWPNRPEKDHDGLEAAVMQAWNHSVENSELMKTVNTVTRYQRGVVN